MNSTNKQNQNLTLSTPKLSNSSTLLSPSRLNMYLNCPLKFKFYYVDNIEPEEISVEMAFGSAVHSTLKFFYRKLQSGEVLSLSDLQSAFTTDFEIQNALPLIYNGEAPEDFLKKGHLMLKTYYESINPNTIKVKAVEQSFKVPIINLETGERLVSSQVDDNLLTNSQLSTLNSQTYYFYGIIDLLEDTTIVEHKTAAKIWDEEKVHTDLQMTIYAYSQVVMQGTEIQSSGAIYRTNNKKPETRNEELHCRFDILTKSKQPKLIQLSTTRTLKDFGRLFQITKNVVKAIENKIFYPIPSWMCSGCYYKDRQCKEWK